MVLLSARLVLPQRPLQGIAFKYLPLIPSVVLVRLLTWALALFFFIDPVQGRVFDERFFLLDVPP